MGKKIKIKENIKPKKRVKPPALEKKQQFSCSYSIFDRLGHFNSVGSKVILANIFKKQGSLENYSRLAQQGSHFISVDKIATEARKRLDTLKLDDYDGLFSFRLNGKKDYYV